MRGNEEIERRKGKGFSRGRVVVVGGGGGGGGGIKRFAPAWLELAIPSAWQSLALTDRPQ